jgi:hypothetical protein
LADTHPVTCEAAVGKKYKEKIKFQITFINIKYFPTLGI